MTVSAKTMQASIDNATILSASAKPGPTTVRADTPASTNNATQPLTALKPKQTNVGQQVAQPKVNESNDVETRLKYF